MSDREDRVGEAVAWYFQAAESGTPPDRAAFLARFPDLRPELESFLADKGAFDHAAGPPVRHPDPDPTVPPPSPNNDTATLPPATDPNATAARADSNPITGPQSDPSLASIRYFGDYELLSEIARGGMGVVFRARQMSLNREVALKMILTGQLASSADVIRFRAEAEAAANLDHPNILPIYEVGEHHGQQYFAMKLVPGGSLAGKVDACVDDPRAAVGVFVKVCRAVDFAHRRGILHRDLKPGNILLDRDGTPYVTDFGLAKKVDADSNLTQSGAIVGTPSYMAPEQARAEKGLTTAADVYALGAILYELLTGRPPFRGPTVLDTVLQVIEKEPADPRAVNPKADRDLSVIALKCLEKKPEKRYESAGALADDLDRWARGEPILAREVTRAERAVKWVKRNPVIAGAALAVVLALTTGATVGYLNFRAARTQEAIARASAEDADREAAEAKRLKDFADVKAAEAMRQQGIAGEKEALAAAAAARATAAATDLAVELRESRRVLALSKLREAQTAFDRNLVQLARDTLAEIPPENRCLVWGLLARRFEGSLFTLYGHTACVAVSADGARVITGSTDGARVRDARTGETLTELKGHDGPVTSVALSADGSRVILGGPSTARVWDARTGQPLTELKGHTGLLVDVAVSADGSRVVTGSWDRTARVWDARTGLALTVLKGHVGSVGSVALSADGSRAVTGSWDMTARVWDTQTGQPLTEFRGHTQQVSSAVLSADGTRVVTGSLDGTARVWDVRTGQTLTELKGHTGGVNSVALSADGTRVVTGSLDNTARVWDVRTGQTLTEFKGHTGGVNRVALSADGSRVVTASWDNTTRVWEVPSARRFPPPGGRDSDGFANTAPALPELRGHTAQVSCAAVSADGWVVVSGSDDTTARVWDVRTGRPFTVLKGHTNWVKGVAVSADGVQVATAGSWDKTARVWDVKTGRSLTELTGHTGPVWTVALSADGTRVVTGSGDGTARVWEVPSARRVPPLGGRGSEGGANTGRFVELRGHTGTVWAVALTADGSRVVTGAEDKTARIWNAETGQTVTELKGHTESVRSVAVSADGARIVTGSLDNTARVWDAKTGQTLTELKGHTGPVLAVALSADGSRVITGGVGENTARVWDAKTGQSLTELKGHTGSVKSVAVSANGSRVVTGSDDNSARVWDARPLTELRGHAAQVNRVALSADGSRVVTRDSGGTTLVWDSATGKPMHGEPVPPLADSGHRTPEGAFVFVPSGDRLLRVPTHADVDERHRRLWLTRPDPDWHVQRQKELLAEGKSYGAAVQVWAEHRARATLALEAGDLDRAWGHFIVAAALKPSVPAPPAIAPPPPATIPLAK